MVASHLLPGYLLKDSLLGSHTAASLAGFLQIFSLLSLLLLASIAFPVWLQIAFQQSGICTHRSGFSVPLWVVIWLARFPSLEAENTLGQARLILSGTVDGSIFSHPPQDAGQPSRKGQFLQREMSWSLCEAAKPWLPGHAKCMIQILCTALF